MLFEFYGRWPVPRWPRPGLRLRAVSHQCTRTLPNETAPLLARFVLRVPIGRLHLPAEPSALTSMTNSDARLLLARSKGLATSLHERRWRARLQAIALFRPDVGSRPWASGRYGPAVLRRLREWSQTPVASSRSGARCGQGAASDAGADDYVTKPFSRPSDSPASGPRTRAQPRGSAVFSHEGLVVISPRAPSSLRRVCSPPPSGYLALSSATPADPDATQFYGRSGPKSEGSRNVRVYLTHLRKKVARDPRIRG